MQSTCTQGDAPGERNAPVYTYHLFMCALLMTTGQLTSVSIKFTVKQTVQSFSSDCMTIIYGLIIICSKVRLNHFQILFLIYVNKT